jgi:SM-20-related protein
VPGDAAPPAEAGPLPDLFAGGCAVVDGFLSGPRVRALIDCAVRRRARGDFTAARIGSHEGLQRRADIRGDNTCWLEAPLFAAERALLADLEGLRLDLNARGFLGLFDLEMHYAWYPPGTGYARHVDHPQGRDHRVVSVIVYLNGAWTPGAGGELRLYAAEGTHRDIAPVGGRLACFLTAGREHEVLTTCESRLSLTGWYRRRA